MDLRRAPALPEYKLSRAILRFLLAAHGAIADSDPGAFVARCAQWALAMATQLRLPKTHHFRERAAERALRPDVEAFVWLFGSDRRTETATMLTVVERELPPDLRDTEIVRRARDWVFVLSPEGALVTCYRKRAAWKKLRVATEDRRRWRRSNALG